MDEDFAGSLAVVLLTVVFVGTVRFKGELVEF